MLHFEHFCIIIIRFCDQRQTTVASPCHASCVSQRREPLWLSHVWTDATTSSYRSVFCEKPPALDTAVNFCLAMLCKRGLCRHAVSVCLFVTFVNSVETNKHIFQISSPSGSHTTLVFFTSNAMAILRRRPPNGGVECRWGRQKWQF